MSKHSSSNLKALLATPTPAGFHRLDFQTDCDMHTLVIDRTGNGVFHLERLELLRVVRRRMPPGLMIDPAEYEKMNEFTKSVTGRELVKPAWVAFMQVFQELQRSYKPAPRPSTN